MRIKIPHIRILQKHAPIFKLVRFHYRAWPIKSAKASRFTKLVLLGGVLRSITTRNWRILRSTTFFKFDIILNSLDLFRWTLQVWIFFVGTDCSELLFSEFIQVLYVLFRCLMVRGGILVEEGLHDSGGSAKEIIFGGVCDQCTGHFSSVLFWITITAILCRFCVGDLTLEAFIESFSVVVHLAHSDTISGFNVSDRLLMILNCT